MKKIKNIFKLYRKKFELTNYKGTINLNLGCGNKPLIDFINIDYHNQKYADIVADLNSRLPFCDNTINLIYSDNVFEHIEKLLLLIQDCHRVLKIDGYLIIKVPYFRSNYAFVDPTHVNFFTIQSMDYFIKTTYFHEEYRFFEESFQNLDIFLDTNNGFWKKIISIYAIKRPNIFENSIWSNLWIFHNIIYILRK